uniref:Uncharacterized protein n=1 Tax=Romanomermis culicivorax TaxID=13658 RepID=A0A915JU52_ROMCU
MKNLTFFKLSARLRAKPKMRPGVPTTMWGVLLFNVSSSFLTFMPPKKTLTLTPGKYLLKRSYSLLIWKANSRKTPLKSETPKILRATVTRTNFRKSIINNAEVSLRKLLLADHTVKQTVTYRAADEQSAGQSHDEQALGGHQCPRTRTTCPREKEMLGEGVEPSTLCMSGSKSVVFGLVGFLGGARAVPPLANVGVGVTIRTRAQQKWPGSEPVEWLNHQSYG